MYAVDVECGASVLVPAEALSCGPTAAEALSCGPAAAEALPSALATNDAARLYRKAVADQWSVDDVQWSAMQLGPVAEPIRQAMAELYEDLLRGEVIGLRLAGRVVDIAPEGWLRQFAASQAMDEARHAEFFGRVIDRLGVRVEPAKGLPDLHQSLLASHDCDFVMLGTFVLESAAQVFFTEGSKHCAKLQRSAVRLPGSDAVAALLDTVGQYIARDESRHVAMGVRFLQDTVQRASESRRRDMKQRLAEQCELLYAVVAERAPAYARLGMGPTTMLRRVQQTHGRQLQQLGLGPVLDVQAVG